MISICITTYNRFDFTIQSFEQVLNDDRVSEVVISDDCSTDDSFEKLKWFFRHEIKVKLFQNERNQDCYRNKKTAIELATNEWCCLWDSDNVFGSDYINWIFDCAFDEKIIFAPTFAYPNFDYSMFGGTMISKENVSEYMSYPMFSTALNTMNFFVNRNEFLKVWDGNIDPVTSDSLYFNYCWLKAGNKIYFVKGMQYFHRVHSLSHYQNNVMRTPNGFHAELENKLKQLH